MEKLFVITFILAIVLFIVCIKAYDRIAIYQALIEDIKKEMPEKKDFIELRKKLYKAKYNVRL